MYRYIRVPRALNVLYTKRSFTNLLTLPLSKESTSKLVAFKSTELLKILNMTHGDVLKLNDQDYNDLNIMLLKLPEIDNSLLQKLTNELLDAKFYEINTKLLTLLLDIISSRDDKSLLLMVVKQISGSLETDLSSEIKQKFYDSWAIHSDDLLQQQLLETYTHPKHVMIFNLLVQTHLLRNEFEKAFAVAKSCLKSNLELDRYTVELFAYHALNQDQLDPLNEIINTIHTQRKNIYVDRYLPLSNNQLGIFISTALSSNRYDIARSLFNRYCYYQKRHYLDKGTLLCFARIAMGQKDRKQLKRVCFELNDTGIKDDAVVQSEIAIFLFESKWIGSFVEERDLMSLKEEFRILGKFENLSAGDFPAFKDYIIVNYPAVDTDMMIFTIRELIGQEDEHENAARLLLKIFFLALSEMGKTEVIFDLLKRVNQELSALSSADQDAVFYIIRSYHNAKGRLTKKSAVFMRDLVLKKRTFKLDSKVYRLFQRVIRERYKGDQEALLAPFFKAVGTKNDNESRSVI